MDMLMPATTVNVARSDSYSVAGRELRTTPMSSSSSGSGAGSGAIVAVETLPSSCTWRQISDADDDSRCVLQPRSCYSCLNIKPTSQEICTLTPDGVCMGADAYDPTRDYRRGVPAATWLPHNNFFPSENSTYCERDDVACASCRDRSFKNWETNPSQHCEGLRGCVCVSICESDSWEVAIQPTLKTALEASTSTFSNCTIQEVNTQDGNATVDSSLSDFVGLQDVKAIYAGTDQCMWVQNQTYCGAPRSCYDCLNTPIYSGAKCMLHSSGYCTSMTSYDVKKDFRRDGRSNNTIALFPSTNTTYCAANDATCARCRQDQSFQQWTSVISPPQFCIGTSGCVCLASCESPLWLNAVVELTCNTSAVQQLTQMNITKYQLSAVAYWSVSALSLLLAMVCALLGLSCVRRWQQHQAAARRRPSRIPQGPTLALSGWKAMREKLIETEREFVGETGSMAHPEGHRLRTTSNASDEPDAGPNSSRASSEVPALLVEEGDAYRPVSPSRMHV